MSWICNLLGCTKPEPSPAPLDADTREVIRQLIDKLEEARKPYREEGQSSPYDSALGRARTFLFLRSAIDNSGKEQR